MKTGFKMSKKPFVLNEYLVLIYRFVVLLLLYAICRVGFYLFNTGLFPNVSFTGFLEILRGGILFDVSGLIYINAIYFVLYLIPFQFKFNQWYQRGINGLFLIINSIGLAANVGDFIYYRFTLKRTTFSVFDIFANEENMGRLWFQFLIDYWHAFLFWLVLVMLMYFLYHRVKPKPIAFSSKWLYSITSLIFLGLFSGFSVIGVRGGYRHSTRPINMSNAGKYVNSPEEMALVLNTPFCMARTHSKKTFKPIHYFNDNELLEKVYTPVHHPNNHFEFRNLNVVVIILESFSREHSGILNPHLNNGQYVGYTPFLDSLITVSYSFNNGFANGRKSIDALPSILASLPALVQPFVVSEYSSNRINGLGMLLREKKYHTSFFHGAPNGSMGFQAFTRMAGFDNYFGKDEYGDAADFDGMWGVWDEPFFQFFANKLNTFPQPFVSSIFSVSSHHPFKVPVQYEGAFPKGTLPIHQCVGYTDMALRRFFETASKMEWFNHTLFVITADHSVTAHFDEYKTNANAFAVPILFYLPQSDLRGNSNQLAQQTDIMPTVLNFLGFNDGFVAFGTDLFKADIENSSYYVLNYLNETFQFLMNNWAIYFDGNEVVAFYNTKDDPFLSNNLKGKEPVPQSELEFMKAVIQQYNNRMIANELTYKNE